VTIRPSWNSGSYDLVKAHVDRYPAGSTVSVAINPADAADVRYELGMTLTNMIGPGALGVMGLLFAAIGGWVLTRSGRPRPASPADTATLTRRVAMLFSVIGAVILGIGIWMFGGDLSMVRTWSPVEAEAVNARAISTRSSVGNRPSSLMYDVQVTFRYTVDGRSYESQTTSGMASSGTARRDELLALFAPGTRHRIHHRPDDPNVIRYNLESTFTTFALSGAMVLMGLVFLGFGALFLRLTRTRREMA
jgi:hypothetical protein